MTAHVAVPLQPAPDQPANVDPAAGVAVSVTAEPSSNGPAQVAPQSRPAGAEETEPAPLPALATLSVNGSPSTRNANRFSPPVEPAPRIRRSPCTASASAEAPPGGLMVAKPSVPNVGSSLPDDVRRQTSPVDGVGLVKFEPATRILPSGCSATALASANPPAVIVATPAVPNVGSSAPLVVPLPPPGCARQTTALPVDPDALSPLTRILPSG